MPRPKLLSVFLPALAGALFIAIWHFVRVSLSEDFRFLLPAPTEVITAFREHGDELWRATLNTTAGATLGFHAAVAVSFTLSLPLVRVTFYPYLMLLQMTPIIVFAPILVLWVGPGLKSVTIITFLICFFPLAVNTTQGLVSTDRNLVELFRLYRATKFQEILRLRIPAALPFFFTGLRIAATLAPIGALVGDYTAGSSAGDGGGLGFQTIIYSSQAKYPALFATAAACCALGFIFVAGVLSLSWLTLHQWHDSYERSDI
jgi:NitT/TauT family transport system permease protein